MSPIRRAAQFVVKHEFLLLWLYGAPLLVSSSLPLGVVIACLLPIPIIWFARKLARGTFSARTPLDIPLFLLLLMGLVGLAVTPEFNTTLRVYAEWIGGIALFYGIVNGLQNTKQRVWGLFALLGIAFAMAVVGLVGTKWSLKYAELTPLYDALPQLDVALLNPAGFNPNLVAGAVAPVIPLGVALVVFGREKWRWLVLALCSAPFVVLLLSQSRGAWMGVAVGVILIAIWRWRKLVWVIPLFALIGGMAFYFNASTLTSFLLASDTTSASERLELWTRATYIMQDFPFTGIGMGTFNEIVHTLYPLFLTSPDTSVPHAHNLYLQMIIDFGFPGFVAFMGLVTTLLVVGVFTILHTRNTNEGALAIGLVASYLVYLIHGLTDVVTFSTKAAVIVWIVSALMVSLYRSFISKRTNSAFDAK